MFLCVTDVFLMSSVFVLNPKWALNSPDTHCLDVGLLQDFILKFLADILNPPIDGYWCNE